MATPFKTVKDGQAIVPIRTGEECIASLRGRKLKVYLSRRIHIETKKRMAKCLAGIAGEPPDDPSRDGVQYFDRVLRVVDGRD